jgi:hypothetical protein
MRSLSSKVTYESLLAHLLLVVFFYQTWQVLFYYLDLLVDVEEEMVVLVEMRELPQLEDFSYTRLNTH